MALYKYEVTSFHAHMLAEVAVAVRLCVLLPMDSIMCLSADGSNLKYP